MIYLSSAKYSKEYHERNLGKIKMKEILKNSEESITLFDGEKTLTKKEIENKLIERLVLKRQNKHLKTKIGGGSQ